MSENLADKSADPDKSRNDLLRAVPHACRGYLLRDLSAMTHRPGTLRHEV